MGSTVDEAAGRIATLARIPQNSHPATSAFVGAMAFYLQGEEPLVVVFDPPKVDRGSAGSARLVGVTSTRVIEIVGDLRGDWTSTFFNRQWDTELSVSVSPLTEFTHFGLTGPGSNWRLDLQLEPRDVLYGTSASLTKTDGQVVALWEHLASDSRVDHEAILRGVAALVVAIGRTEVGGAR